MAKPAIYIDGQEGTTGLRIREMLAPREDLELLLIPTKERKDLRVRREFLNRADLCVLCLPDDAAAEALAMIDNPQTRVIDTSTARRVDSDLLRTAFISISIASLASSDPSLYAASTFSSSLPLINRSATPCMSSTGTNDF